MLAGDEPLTQKVPGNQHSYIFPYPLKLGKQVHVSLQRQPAERGGGEGHIHSRALTEPYEVSTLTWLKSLLDIHHNKSNRSFFPLRSYCDTGISAGQTITGTAQEMILFFRTVSDYYQGFSAELTFVPQEGCR